MVDNANSRLELVRKGGRIGDGRLEEEVDDVVSVVSHRGLIAIHLRACRCRPQAQLGLAARRGWQRGDLPHRVLPAERRDLDGKREGGAQAVAKLGLVDNDDEFLRAHLNHLLAQQCAAATLDQVKLRINRIRAVDRDIELRVRVEGDERDAEGLSLLLGTHRSGHRDDVLQLARLELLTHALHRKRSGRACAQADDHARRHVIID
mmetsp:Transcript_18532/g.47701  ORF Transcript_18532/g.47701 Transcript_18532/m.47701 type:complete len:206 (+) Transcript_18532:380-997(+)